MAFCVRILYFQSFLCLSGPHSFVSRHSVFTPVASPFFNICLSAIQNGVLREDFIFSVIFCVSRAPVRSCLVILHLLRSPLPLSLEPRPCRPQAAVSHSRLTQSPRGLTKRRADVRSAERACQASLSLISEAAKRNCVSRGIRAPMSLS